MIESRHMVSVVPLNAFTDNYIWVIMNTTSDKAWCVDPGEASPVIEFVHAHQLNLEGILITHHHFDHINGLATLAQHFSGLQVYAPEDARIPYVTSSITNEPFLNISDYKFEILQTPGHTTTHLCYYEVNHHWLFCGDTLFSGGCGRVFEGTYEELYHSLERLKSLPDETKVFCGHEYTRKNLHYAKTVEPQNQAIQAYLQKLEQPPLLSCSLPSTIGLEKKINPFLRIQTPTIKKHAAKSLHDAEDPIMVFKHLRVEKNKF